MDNEQLTPVRECETLKKENARLRSEAERNFRWSYQLLTAFAQYLLADANRLAQDDAWPAGQAWGDFVGTSRAVFLRLARKQAGIDHDAYLAGIRDGQYDIDDIYDGVKGTPE